MQDLNDSEVEQELSGLTNADDVPGSVGSVSLNYLPCFRLNTILLHTHIDILNLISLKNVT